MNYVSRALGSRSNTLSQQGLDLSYLGSEELFLVRSNPRAEFVVVRSDSLQPGSRYFQCVRIYLNNHLLLPHSHSKIQSTTILSAEWTVECMKHVCISTIIT